MSLELTDKESAAVAKAPRVSLADIQAAIAGVYYTNGGAAIAGSDGDGETIAFAHLTQLAILTICIVVMRNGFTVIGKAAPASPDNFNRELGRKFAYEDAVRQIWPLMGFALRDKLAAT